LEKRGDYLHTLKEVKGSQTQGGRGGANHPASLGIGKEAKESEGEKV